MLESPTGYSLGEAAALPLEFYHEKVLQSYPPPRKIGLLYYSERGEEDILFRGLLRKNPLMIFYNQLRT